MDLIVSLLVIFYGVSSVSGATFTFVNKCDYTVWPGILGNPRPDTTGFELPKGTTHSFQAPTGWSGRFWGRTGCNFDSTGDGSCATGDCGSNQIQCNGAGAAPPATLAEFTLGSGSQDFYDVSLVDGYNLPMIVEPNGGLGSCESTGCVTDISKKCPSELRAEGGAACLSACEAFGSPEYCCSGAYNTPSACKPSVYSVMFKSACPKSYSYAYDDATSTFTCSAADYTITFCPNLRSLKSPRDSNPKPTKDGTATETEQPTMQGSTATGTEQPAKQGSTDGSVQEAALANSLLANLATGGSTRTANLNQFLQYGFVLAISIIICYYF